MKKISIIVPVYNTEQFLEKCLKSLVNQTISNLLKIIIVNDGTKDNSERVILKFKQKYPDLIEYYKKDNGGLSSARNYGIKKCNTEYIGFVDSDDYVNREMFEKMYKTIKKENMDIVVCGLNKYNKYGDTIQCNKLGQQGYLDYNEGIRQILMGQLDTYACNKLFKTSLFKENKINFPEGRLYEDTITIYKLIKSSRGIYFIDEPLYNYIQHNESISNTPRFKAAEDLLLTLEEVIQEEYDNTFTARMVLNSSIEFHRWFHAENKEDVQIKNINQYKKNIKKYKRRVKLLKFLLDKNIGSKTKIKYIILKFGLIKYVC